MKLETEILFVILTYLWASIPYGYILTKVYTGKNIMEHGSGNIGSTNVSRVAGKKISIATQLLDMLKGFLPIAMLYFLKDEGIISPSPYYIYIIALTAIIGHNFSIFLKFKGGKGVNTTLGASVLIAPYSIFISVAIYFLVKWIFKYVSLGSIALGVSLPVSAIIINGISPTFYYLLICALLIVVMHRENINRLIHKKEMY